MVPAASLVRTARPAQIGWMEWDGASRYARPARGDRAVSDACLALGVAGRDSGRSTTGGTIVEWTAPADRPRWHLLPPARDRLRESVTCPARQRRGLAGRAQRAVEHLADADWQHGIRRTWRFRSRRSASGRRSATPPSSSPGGAAPSRSRSGPATRAGSPGRRKAASRCGSIGSSRRPISPGGGREAGVALRGGRRGPADRMGDPARRWTVGPSSTSSRPDSAARRTIASTAMAGTRTSQPAPAPALSARPELLADRASSARMIWNVERTFGPVGMCGFDRARLSEDASRGCCSGLVNQAAKRSTWQPPVDSRPRCVSS